MFKHTPLWKAIRTFKECWGSVPEWPTVMHLDVWPDVCPMPKLYSQWQCHSCWVRCALEGRQSTFRHFYHDPATLLVLPFPLVCWKWAEYPKPGSRRQHSCLHQELFKIFSQVLKFSLWRSGPFTVYTDCFFVFCCIFLTPKCFRSTNKFQF